MASLCRHGVPTSRPNGTNCVRSCRTNVCCTVAGAVPLFAVEGNQSSLHRIMCSKSRLVNSVCARAVSDVGVHVLRINARFTCCTLLADGEAGVAGDPWRCNRDRWRVGRCSRGMVGGHTPCVRFRCMHANLETVQGSHNVGAVPSSTCASPFPVRRKQGARQQWGFASVILSCLVHWDSRLRAGSADHGSLPRYLTLAPTMRFDSAAFRLYCCTMPECHEVLGFAGIGPVGVLAPH